MKKYYLLITLLMLFSCLEEVKKKDIVYLSPDCGCCRLDFAYGKQQFFFRKKHDIQHV